MSPDLSLRFTLHTLQFQHGGFGVDLIAPSAPDELIDVSDFNTDERLPYWAELWPSARALAVELLESAPPPGRVLELGCGIALPSLALRSRGIDVTASDYYSEALEFTLANATRNSIDPPVTLLLDWRDPPAEIGPFDLIIAADVLYEQRNADALAPLLPRLLAPGGRALIADPGRSYVGHFQRLLEAQDWHIEEISRRHEPPSGGNGPPITVRLYSIHGDPPPK